MSTKYKLHELAKDLNIDNQEVINILAKQFEGAKKASTALTDEEANYVLECYSQSHQVDSLDDFFKKINEKKPKAAEKV